MEDINHLQTLFTVFYSILYGIMLNACIGLSLFSWGRFNHEYVRNRIFISIIIINFCPLFYFISIYNILEHVKIPNYNHILGVFLTSFFVFFFYRLIILFIKEFKDILYCLDEYIYNKNLHDRVYGIGEQINQLYGLFFYLTLAIIGVLILFYGVGLKDIINDILF